MQKLLTSELGSDILALCQANFAKKGGSYHEQRRYSCKSTDPSTSYVGGLIGFNTGDISSATISNFSSAINVTGAGYVGGLIGATYGTRIAIGTSVTIKINLYA